MDNVDQRPARLRELRGTMPSLSRNSPPTRKWPRPSAKSVPQAASKRFFLAVVVGGLPGLGARLEAYEIVIQADVDHAADRTGPPCRGGTAGHHVDAFDDDRRDRVQVVVAGDAATVLQHQGARDAQAAQIDRRVAGTGIGAGGLRRTGRAELRQVIERGADVGARIELQLFGGDRQGRRRRHEVGAVDARGGDADRGEIADLAIAAFFLGLGMDAGRGGQACQNAQRQGMKREWLAHFCSLPEFAMTGGRPAWGVPTVPTRERTMRNVYGKTNFIADATGCICLSGPACKRGAGARKRLFQGARRHLAGRCFQRRPVSQGDVNRNR